MMYLRYFRLLLRHKWFVLQAGVRIGGIPLWRLLVHDWTKFLPVEFVGYARWFFGIRSLDRWAKAWHHHQRHNAHHPEYYTLAWRGDPDFYHGLGQRVADCVVVLPMPYVHVREMLVDFMASSKAYTGSWDITAWLAENFPKMRLHTETAALFTAVCREQGVSVRGEPPSVHRLSWSD